MTGLPDGDEGPVADQAAGFQYGRVRLNRPDRGRCLVRESLRLRIGDPVGGGDPCALCEYGLDDGPVVPAGREVELIPEHVPQREQGRLLETPPPERGVRSLTSGLGDQTGEAPPASAPTLRQGGPELGQCDAEGRAQYQGLFVPSFPQPFVRCAQGLVDALTISTECPARRLAGRYWIATRFAGRGAPGA